MNNASKQDNAAAGLRRSESMECAVDQRRRARAELRASRRVAAVHGGKFAQLSSSEINGSVTLA